MPGFKKGNKHGKRFQPGQSGNPAGRKKGSKNIKTQMKKLLEMGVSTKLLAEIRKKDSKIDDLLEPYDLGDIDNSTILAVHIFTEALKGSAQHAKLFIEHTEGLPVQEEEISFDDDTTELLSELVEIFKGSNSGEAREYLKGRRESTSEADETGD